MIQGVINRLATNSFLLKGWSVILLSALFALSATNSRSAFVCLAYIPVIVFWGLDGFFLWQERLYRRLYDYVRMQKDEDIDFSMDTASFTISEDRPTWRDAVLSKTLVLFYGGLVASIAVVMVLLYDFTLITEKD